MKLEADHDSMGLRQINTDRATSDEDGDTRDVSFTPEEIVLRRLQVTVEEQHASRKKSQHQSVGPEKSGVKLQPSRE